MTEKTNVRSIADLKVYLMAFETAMEIFHISKKFPKEEQYSLTDQIRRSSRSVAINIREGFAKRRYSQVFVRHLNDSLGSSEETRGWLDFAFQCGYIVQSVREDLDKRLDIINAMLFSLMNNWMTVRSRKRTADN
jgi:four helix bundle protein